MVNFHGRKIGGKGGGGRKREVARLWEGKSRDRGRFKRDRCQYTLLATASGLPMNQDAGREGKVVFHGFSEIQELQHKRQGILKLRLFYFKNYGYFRTPCL